MLKLKLFWQKVINTLEFRLLSHQGFRTSNCYFFTFSLQPSRWTRSISASDIWINDTCSLVNNPDKDWWCHLADTASSWWCRTAASVSAAGTRPSLSPTVGPQRPPPPCNTVTWTLNTTLPRRRVSQTTCCRHDGDFSSNSRSVCFRHTWKWLG